LSEGLRSEDQLRFYQLKVRAREANPYSETGRFIQSLGTRRFIIKYAVVFILGLAAGHAQTTAHNAGRRTFESSCAPCHGLNGKGGEHAPDIATRPDIVGLSDSEILKVLREGKPQAGMPPFTGLGTAKLSNILNYSYKVGAERLRWWEALKKVKKFSPAKQAVRCAIWSMVRGDFLAQISRITGQATPPTRSVAP
jgi:mono/diheme cytochrome c family protein